MKGPRMVRVLACVLALGVVAGGNEIALANATTGHSFRTALTLSARKHTVASGADVHVYGNLSSGRNRCKTGQAIEIDRDGAAVGSATTTGTGHYSFTDAAPAAGTYSYQAKFAGSTFGKTGQNTCKASQSRTTKVTVRA